MGVRRDLQIKAKADALLEVMDEGQRLPGEYGQPGYWTRLLTAAAALVETLPLPQKGPFGMQNWIAKLGILTGAASAIVGVLSRPDVLGLLPPKAAVLVGTAGTIMAVVSGVLHPSPTQNGSAA